PSLYDRIGRLVDLASVMMDPEPSLAKECLQTAMASLVKCDASGYRSVQRRIVDLAYKLDPNLADSLASLVDDDSARGSARARLNPTLTAPGTSERRGEEELWRISRSYGFLLSIHPLKCLDTWKSEIALTYHV